MRKQTKKAAKAIAARATMDSAWRIGVNLGAQIAAGVNEMERLGESPTVIAAALYYVVTHYCHSSGIDPNIPLGMVESEMYGTPAAGCDAAVH